MRLHLVRHGQTLWNSQRRIQGQLETELDATGIQQAIDRGADFADMPLTAVYSSSSVRTRQTTEHLLGSRDDIVTFRDDLREVRLGVWQGHYWEDIERDFPALVQAHRTASASFDVEGAEKSIDVQERGVNAIESIISAHKHAQPHENILIISHGAIMHTILAHYNQVALSDLHTLPSLPNCAHCIIRVEGLERIVETIAGVAFEDSEWINAPNCTTTSTNVLNNQPAASGE